MNKVILLLVALISISLAIDSQKPIIGIFMLPSTYDSHPAEKYSEIPASYVKFLEMSGSRVVPIHYDAEKSYYDYMFDQLNGLLFTGGAASFEKGTQVGDNGYYLFQKVKEANDNGTHYPLWGTCLGFQMLAKFAADFEDVVGDIEGEDSVNRTIKVLEKASIYENMPAQLLNNSQTETIHYYHHSHDVTPQTYESNEKLNSFYHMCATSQNDEGEEFIATFEAKNYPIFGTQFHPEKASFEWRVNANHTLNAVEMNTYYTNFFVEHTKQNDNRFSSEEEANEFLIYNYSPVFLPDTASFEQVYFFENFHQKYQQDKINKQE